MIFIYNGQYVVLTDPNGLLYMRTRFYNPNLKRFINADIIDGSIDDSTSLNLYTYVNGNPISFVDPFGMVKERGNNGTGWKLCRPLNADYTDELRAHLEDRIANSIINLLYDSLIVKALKNTSKDIVSHYERNYRGNVEQKYAPYQDTINKVITMFQSQKPLQDFDSDMKLKIEVDTSVDTFGEKIMGDIIGFIPYFGEMYAFTEIISEENTNFSELGSVLMSAIMEKDIAELTPYADMLGKLGGVFTAIGVIELINDCTKWNSPENIKPMINIYVQQNQGSTYWYSVYVNSDMSFKTYWSGFTGTVLQPEDDTFSMIFV